METRVIRPLRPYQVEAIEAMRSSLFGEDNVLCVLPTGSGKTRCLISLVEWAVSVKPGIRIGMVMGRIDLVDQTERAFRLDAPAVRVGVYCGSLKRYETDRTLTLVSIQSGKASDFKPFDLMIVDEVHEMDQREGAYVRLIEGMRDKNLKMKLIGVTATAFRSTGLIYGKGQLFERVCYRRTIPQMVEGGYLCLPVLRAGAAGTEHNVSGLRLRAGEYAQEDVDKLVSDGDRCTAQVKDALTLLHDRSVVLWACANIEHVNLVADRLMALGERCTTVHSKLKAVTRADNMAAFIGGSVRHMAFVSVLSTGWDHPPSDALVIMRPIRSPVLYVQMAGRVLRTSPGKSDALILDYGQVVGNCGPLDDPSIAKGGGMKERGGELIRTDGPGLKMCEACRGFCPPAMANCPHCESPFPVQAPSEKLDRTAQTGKILSEKRPAAPVVRRLGPITIGLHESKSGNMCFKIHYQDSAIVTRWGFGGVTEYFVRNNAWAMERFNQRLDGLDISLQDYMEGMVTYPGTFEVETVEDGKYERVRRVTRVSDESPCGDDDDDDDEDIGSWFGANDPSEIGFK